MTKQFLRLAVLIFISVFIFSSCKKTHPLNAYPENVRMQSFTKKTTKNTTNFVTYEIYTFAYDGYNRVSQIVHSKNDGSANKISTFTYVNDTIYDTVRYVNQVTALETSFYITDQKGLISYTYEPGLVTSYKYEGKLVSHKTLSTGADFTYTSYNYNLLRAESPLFTTLTLDFRYWTDKFNRTGDYLQLNSFQQYGFNFYQNDRLIRNIANPDYNIAIDYAIDVENKITQTTAMTTNNSHDTTVELYDLQYQNF